ncbi:hypothetical protein [Planomonospora sp. ID82291]|uniref:hypothetical protein n=1 Tax=Planomonospora sp. ID82291 TaxID=2738136 RepID=UPI0018C3E19A|nr:hypothetical protein [Planomonospora sp. ID82291]MBG0816231.1 hypothetical protein [Planomonospora sp. ID82291]
MIEEIIALAVPLGVPAALVCGSVVFAARSAPAGRHDPVPGHHLLRGAALSAAGVAVMALTAWLTHEDEHYDDFGAAMTGLAGVAAGALLIFGLGPFVPWLLGVLGRNAVRLPAVLRPAARHMAGRPYRTAPGVAAATAATAVAVAVMIIGFAVTAQDRAAYRPSVRPGALLVAGFPPDRAAAVRAAVQRELPGVAVVQNNRPSGSGSVIVETSRSSEHSSLYEEYPDVCANASTHHCTAIYIGDRALLRYLTADPSPRYGEGTAVVIAADGDEADSAEIRYSSADGPSLSRTVPAITVSPADPWPGGVFIPEEAVRDLGLRLEPERLIVDPSLHRTSVAERERLDHRLGEGALTYLERGFEAPAGWPSTVAVVIPIALAGALIAARSTGSGPVPPRLGGGRAALRLLVSCRAAYGAACATVTGACAGCVIGLLLAWPMTTSSDWEPLPRVPFDTPWALIAALVVGLPVLAAAVAALAPPGRPTRTGPAR